MAITIPLRLQSLKSTLISALLLSLSSSALAATIQTPECEIFGDPDVYGIGIRWSFYLQWAALVVFSIDSYLWFRLQDRAI